MKNFILPEKLATGIQTIMNEVKTMEAQMRAQSSRMELLVMGFMADKDVPENAIIRLSEDFTTVIVEDPQEDTAKEDTAKVVTMPTPKKKQ